MPALQRQHPWMNGAYLDLGAVSHGEHAQRDGRELGRGNTISARNVRPRDPRPQWSPARVDEFEDGAEVEVRAVHPGVLTL